MAKGKSGSFGSRKGVRTPPVMVQGNQMRVGKDPAPWFADFDSLAAQCTALTTSPAIVLNFIRDEELMAKVDREALNTSILSMNELIRKEKDRLKDLIAETNAMRNGAPADGDKPARLPIKAVSQENTIELLNHGEQFQFFMNDWLRVIYFALDEVLQHFRNVGADIPVLCPASPGYEKEAAGMTMDEVVQAQNVSFNEIATEVEEEDRIGKLIIGVLQAAELKSRHRKGLISLLKISGNQFDKLVAGDYRQFTLTKLKDMYSKMEMDTFEQNLAAAEQAEVEQARGQTPTFAQADEAAFKSE